MIQGPKFALQAMGRYISRRVVDDMPDLMRCRPLKLIRRQRIKNTRIF